MIGVVDLDLQLSDSTKLHPPNLEIMKVATYYRVEEQQFCRLIDLNETNLDSYDKIYVYSELNSMNEVPQQFLGAPNVQFGGAGLTNGVYIPFENQIIDYTIPRKAVYKEFLKQKTQDGIKTSVINHLLDDSYYRCYAGENYLPLPPMLKNKKIYLFDTTFFYPNWRQTIEKIRARMPSSIFCIHPIVCDSLEQYKELRQETIVSRMNNIILNFQEPLSEIPYLIKEYRNFLLGDIIHSSNVFLALGGTFPTNHKYFKDFIYKMNILYYFWSQSIPVKLWYSRPQVGAKDALSALSQFIVTWARYYNKPITIDEKISKKLKKNAAPLVEAKKLLLKFHPTAKDLFTQTYADLSNRRYWRI